MTVFRREQGMALPLVLSVIAILFALTAVAVVVATHGTDRSNRDRSSARALQAAEAGLDAAQWRLNKILASAPVTGLLGLPEDVIRQLGCVNLNVADGTIVVEPLDGPGWCEPAATEDVDEGLPDDGTGDPATFEYWVSSGIEVGSGVGATIERRIVAVGRNGGVLRRVMGVVEGTLQVNASDPIAVFDRVSFVECSSVEPSQPNPAAGCAS